MEDVKTIDTATNEAETVTPTESASPIETTTAVEPSAPLSTRDSMREVFASRKTETETEPVSTEKSMADSVARAVDPISGKELEPIRAPGSWTPALREKWNGIDREAQKFINDRERHVQVTLQESKTARDFTKKFSDIAAPYTKHFPPGVDAAEVAGQLFQIDNTIRNGSPAEKAQLLFQIMQRSAPDLNVLNNLMRNYAPQAVTQPAPRPVDIDSEVQKRIDAEAQKLQDEELGRVFEQFQNDPKHEFMHSDAIRYKMGQAITSELVTKGANDLETLENAYQFVCRNDDQVQAILAARAGAGRQATGAAQAPRPVGSVAPSLGGGTAKPIVKVDSTKEAMRQAMRQRGGKV